MPKAVENVRKTRIDRRCGKRVGRLDKRHVGLATLERRHQLDPDLLVGLGLIHRHGVPSSYTDAHPTFLARKSRIDAAISRAWVSSAKWPVSSNRTSALRLWRLNASAPDGRKKRIVLAPHREQRRSVRAEVFVELRVPRDIAGVIEEQVEL